MKGNDMDSVKRYDDFQTVRADGYWVLYDDFAAVVAERDALAAVVAKLPKTADGKPIHFGGDYFYLNQDDGHVYGCGVLLIRLERIDSDSCDWEISIRDEEGCEEDLLNVDLYSTRAAALASKANP